MTQEFINSYTMVIETITKGGVKFITKPNVNSELAVSMDVYKVNAGINITIQKDGIIRMSYPKDLVASSPGGRDYTASQEKKGMTEIRYGKDTYNNFVNDFNMM